MAGKGKGTVKGPGGGHGAKKLHVKEPKGKTKVGSRKGKVSPNKLHRSLMGRGR